MTDNANIKDVKVTDRSFLQGIIISVLSVLLSIVALCSATFAWLNETTESNRQILTPGSFDLTVSIVDVDGDDVAETPVEATNATNSARTFRYSLPEPGQYTVTLVLDEKSTAKGHCIVTINGIEKRTDVIIGDATANKDDYKENSPFSFVIETTEQDTVVEFSPVWGMVDYPDIKANESHSADQWN